MERIALFTTLLFFTSCAKERLDAANGPYGNGWMAVTINEVLASGSEQVNEFGEASDWLELHNAGNDVDLEAGAWFISDDPEQPLKYELPALHFEEGGYMVIWCDGMDTQEDEVHTNFALASEGEQLTLTRVVDGRRVTVNTIYTGATHSGAARAIGRYPDGTDTWLPLALPTPGGPNEAYTE